MKRHLLFLLPILFFCISFSIKATPERPLVLVTCMYNNAKWVVQSFNSIFKQKYSNYRVIVVDDGSTDGTPDIIRNYLNEHHLNDKVTFIANKVRRRKMANLYKAYYLCHDYERIVLLDGDDYLAHDQVFSKINEVAEHSWFSYGQYINVPAQEARKWGFSPKGYAAPIPSHVKKNHSYRQHRFLFMHIRSFDAWLFKQIHLEDFLSDKVTGYEGNWYPASNDLAVFWPIVEMAHYHIAFIPEILYIRNLFSEIVGFKVDRKVQLAAAGEIKHKKPYPALEQPVYRNIEQYRSMKATVYLLCDSSIEKIAKQLKALYKYCSHIEHVYVLYQPNKKRTAEFAALKKDFPQAHLIPYSHGTNNLKHALLRTLHECTTQHLLIWTINTAPVTQKVDLGDAIYWLERTFAHAFYLGLMSSKNRSRWLINVDENVYAWKFKFATQEWSHYYSLDGTLYKKEQLQNMLVTLDNFDTLEEFVKKINKLPAPARTIGLTYSF